VAAYSLRASSLFRLMNYELEIHDGGDDDDNAIMLMFRNTADNTWTLSWCGTNSLSWHIGDGYVHLRIAGCVHWLAALAPSAK